MEMVVMMFLPKEKVRMRSCRKWISQVERSAAGKGEKTSTDMLSQHG